MRVMPRCDFQAYVHPTRRVDGLARDTGLRQTFSSGSRGWQVVVYAREA